MNLADAFRASWPGVVHDVSALDEALDEFASSASAAIPAVNVQGDEFVRFVASRIDAEADPIAELTELRPADLLVAFGCMNQDPAAIRWFQESVMNVIRSVVAGSDPSAADDAYQVLFCRLFLPIGGEERPKIDVYDGRRDLGRWVRTLARHGAIDQLRGKKAMTPLEVEHVDRIGEMLDDQEASYLRRTCWAEFKAALADAFAELEPRQRNVLRCHLKGLTAEQIGRIYRAHRVTVARWLAAIRFSLLESTRAGLRRRLAGDEASVDSIVRMVEFDMTASLARLVGTTTV